jgi:glyoxylate reductase
VSRIFVTRRIPEAGLALLREAGVDVFVGQENDEAPLDHDVLLYGIRDADVLLSLLTEWIDGEVLAHNGGLLGVANYAVGFNNIDVAAATELGIPVSNTPGALTETTADLTWALLLAVARRIPEAHAYMTSGRYKLWGPNLLLGEDVSTGGSGLRKVLGVVGYGRIGRAVAKRAFGFDMDVLAYDPHARSVIENDAGTHWTELDELLARSDFVTLHPVLTPETRHLIGERELRLMKRSAFLINVSRGPVVDENALVQGLKEGLIAGAALDVYENEPALAPGLVKLPNVVLVPHIASASRDTRDRMAIIAATNALAHLRRERAPECLNPQVYDTPAYTARVARRLQPP